MRPITPKFFTLLTNESNIAIRLDDVKYVGIMKKYNHRLSYRIELKCGAILDLSQSGYTDKDFKNNRNELIKALG